MTHQAGILDSHYATKLRLWEFGTASTFRRIHIDVRSEEKILPSSGITFMQLLGVQIPNQLLIRVALKPKATPEAGPLDELRLGDDRRRAYCARSSKNR